MHENDRRHCDRKVSNETINESSLKIISFRLFHDFPSFVFLALKRNKFTGKLSRKEEKKFNPISSNFPDIPNRIYSRIPSTNIHSFRKRDIASGRQFGSCSSCKFFRKNWWNRWNGGKQISRESSAGEESSRVNLAEGVEARAPREKHFAAVTQLKTRRGALVSRPRTCTV